MLLTDRLDVAYELLEIRSGDGLRTIYRTGKTPAGTVEAVRVEVAEVLDKAFGEDGRRKRENLARFREKCLELWKEGGAARRATEEFLDSL